MTNEEMEMVQAQVDIYCNAIAKLCEPLNIEVVNSYLGGNKVLVVKFNPSLEEKNQQEFKRIQQFKGQKFS